MLLCSRGLDEVLSSLPYILALQKFWSAYVTTLKSHTKIGQETIGMCVEMLRCLKLYVVAYLFICSQVLGTPALACAAATAWSSVVEDGQDPTALSLDNKMLIHFAEFGTQTTDGAAYMGAGDRRVWDLVVSPEECKKSKATKDSLSTSLYAPIIDVKTLVRLLLDSPRLDGQEKRLEVAVTEEFTTYTSVLTAETLDATAVTGLTSTGTKAGSV